MRKHSLLLSIAILIALSACSQKAEEKGLAAPMKLAQKAAVSTPTNDQIRQPSETRRFVALKHQIEIEFPAANLQAAFDATLKKVDDLGGELLDASINRETAYSPPSASISLRLPPDAVGKFLDGIEQSGKVLRHQREAADKTDEVIDADARIANLTELRNRLRRMLTEKSAQIKDVIEIEKQLADTQAELDTFNGVRKALSKQTDFVAVQIEFRAATSISEGSFFAPIVNAWNQAGNVLMSSAGGLITFIAAILPWLAILIPAFWLIGKVWRRWRDRRSVKKIAATR
jgi:hypothetical protein